MKILGYTITIKIEKITRSPVEVRRELAKLVDEQVANSITKHYCPNNIARIKAVRVLGAEHFKNAEILDNGNISLKWAKEWVESSFSDDGSGEIL